MDDGFDHEALRVLSTDIDRGFFPRTHAVLVEKGGQVVLEKYLAGDDERWGKPLGHREMEPDSLHDLRSVTKSINAALLGIAIGKDFDAALARPILSFFPNLPPRRELAGLTLHHCLTMTAGFQWNEMTVPYTDPANDEIRLSTVKDPVAAVLALPVREKPGERWYYNGGISQVLAGVVESLTGKPVSAYAKEVLFGPLDIKVFEWLGAPAWEPPRPSAASGLRLRLRDLAKFGKLYLQGGKWNGRQVVPEEWVRRSIQRHVASIGEWSRNGTWGYGYQWWIGRFEDGFDVAAAVGNGNQRLFVVPQEDLVITVFAGDYNNFQGHSERILRRVVAARRQLALL